MAVKFDIYSNAGEGTDSTGMYVDGAIADGAGSGHDEFGSDSAERRRDECAAQLQRDDADPDDHGCDHVKEFHDQLDGEHSDDGGEHDGAGGVHGRHGRVDGDSGRSELDLQHRVEHESAADTDEFGGDGGERAGGVELECVEWSDQLQREAVDDEWGTVHDDRESDDDELHGHGGDERDDVLLRGVGGEHGGRECQLQPGECDAAGGGTTAADELGGDGGEWAGGVELECVEWSDQLQREAVDDEWGTVHDDRQSDDDELHGHGGDERDDVLLRGVGGEHGGGECQLQPGECDAAGGTTTADELDGDGGERAGGVELECVEWSDQLQREAVDDEWGTVHDDRESDDDELHGHGGDERDDVLLRGVGGEHGGGECQLQPGECDAASAVPPPPTNLVATAGNGQVGLSWSASSGATSYNVKRSTTSGGPYTTIASPTTTSYTDTGVTNGTTYYYVVSAVNTAGESANSSQVSATPQVAVPPPPTN